MKFMPRLKVALFAIALLSMVSFAAVSVQKVSASYVKDCTANSIMQCGAGSPDEFIRVTKLNAPGDLPTVYSSFGLAPTDYSRFVTTAKAGTLYKSSGKIVVDGQTVATNAWSIGRDKKSYSWAKTIGTRSTNWANTAGGSG